MGCRTSTSSVRRGLFFCLSALFFLLTLRPSSPSWAINHLSHFLLTTTLLPLLQQTRALPGAKDGDVRIVLQSSELHRSTVPFDVKFEKRQEVEDGERDPNFL